MLVCELESYVPREAMDDIREAYRQRLADGTIIGLDEIEESLARGDAHWREELASCRTTRIEDTVEELEEWFRDVWNTAKSQVFPELQSGLQSGADSETIRRTEPRVGRNEPCPCGSGKKFKKCCGKS